MLLWPMRCYGVVFDGADFETSSWAISLLL
jgi:hypothetical protein